MERLRVLLTLWAGLALLPLSNPVWSQLIGIDFGPGYSQANWNSVTDSGVHRNLLNDEGERTGVSLTLPDAGEPFAVSPATDSIPMHSSDLSRLDGNQYRFAGTFQARLSGLEAGAPYRVYLFGLRSGADAEQEVRIVGSDQVSFIQKAPDGMLAINDQVGSSSRDLPSYAKVVTASAEGTLEFTIKGRGTQGKPFVVAGLAIEPPASSASTAGNTQSAGATAVPVARTQEASPAPAPEPSGPDIIGVYLEMPLDDAFAAVSSAYPEIPLKMIQGDIGSIYRSRLQGLKYPGGFQGEYFVPGSNEKISVLGYPPPHDGAVAAVGRFTYLDDMLMADLRDSLIEKYGEPLFEAEVGTAGLSGHTLSWSLTRDGNPQTDPEMIKRCTATSNTQTWRMTGQVYLLWDTAEQMDGYFDPCGYTLVAVMHPTNLPTITRGLSMLMYDLNKIRTRTRDALDLAEQEAEKIESERERAAAGKKARL